MWQALFASATAQASAGAAGPLSSGDRGQLVDDLFTITEAALPEQLAQGVNTVFALKLARAMLPVERAYEAWVPALNHLASTFAFVFPDVPLASAGNAAVSPFDGAAGAADQACVAALSAAARAAIAPLLSSLGNFSNAATASVPLLVQLQASALNAASFFGDAGTIAQALAFFQGDWLSAPVDFQSAILRSVSRWSAPGDGTWTTLRDEYVELSALGSPAASRVLGALSATFDRTQLAAALAFAASDSVRVGDKVGLISGVAANPYGRNLAFTFIKANWRSGLNLFGLYGPGGFDLSSLTRATGAGFVTQEYADAIVAFFAANPVEGSVHDLSQAIEGVQQRVSWRAAGEKASTCAYLAGS